MTASKKSVKKVRNAIDEPRAGVEAVRGVSINLIEALDELLKRRPYMSLAMAVGMGMFLGGVWRR